VREKERGTIEQLLVSPLSALQVMLAKVGSMVVVMLAGTAIALFGIMQPVYGVPAKGSLPLLFALTAVYAFATAGLGLAAATFARTSGQTGLLVMLIVMPMVTLSGTWTPFESMPAWLRGVMTLSPLRHFVDIVYSILLRGAGLDVLWDSETGTCGTCRTKYIEIEADHRDLVLAEHEKADTIMICVSRAKSDEITLDR